MSSGSSDCRHPVKRLDATHWHHPAQKNVLPLTGLRSSEPRIEIILTFWRKSIETSLRLQTNCEES
jgi:hypothetical protein